jgi:hypothetical protein
MGSQNSAYSILGTTTAVSTSYTLGPADYFLEVNTALSLSAVVITLPVPTANQNGRVVVIKDSAGYGAISNIVITPASGTTLDGSTSSITIFKNFGNIQLFCDGTAYYVQEVNNGYMNMQSFSVSGNYIYTPATGMLYVIVECVGGGGGGGGVYGQSGSTSSVGSGGGAGGYVRFFATAAQIGSSQAISVGSGGTSAQSAGGSAGGNTTFGSLITARGGSGGGTVQQTSTGPVPGGSGGSVSYSGVTLMALIGGQSGQVAFLNPSASLAFPGSGGSTVLGVGGYCPGGYLNLSGNPGNGYGAGGSGAVNGPYGGGVSLPGGSGAGGALFITEFLF